jgi:hypothetical protein
MYFSHQTQNCSILGGLQSALTTQAIRLQTYLAKGQSKRDALNSPPCHRTYNVGLLANFS